MLAKPPTIPTAMGANWPSLLGCQLGTVDAVGEMHKPDACKRAMQTVTWTDARVRLDIPHIPLTLGGAGLSAQWAKGVLWMELGGAGLSTQVGSEPTVCQWEKAHNTGSGEHRATATEV